MRLDGLGLTKDEQQTYLALLGQPPVTLDRLATDLQMSNRSTSRHLDTLTEKALITEVAGRPRRYTVIDPAVAIEGLAQRQIERARAATTLIPALVETFWAAQSSTRSQDVVEVVTGKHERSLERANQLQRAARSCVRTFDAPPYFEPRPLEESSDLAMDNIVRGVRYKTIYGRAAVEAPARWADLTRSMDAGEDCRMVEQVPVKMMLIDDWAARVTLLPATEDTLTLVIVHRSSLLDALSALFDLAWDRALPLRPEMRSSADIAVASDARRDRLVALLSSGLSDQAIQHHLRLSASTVQRSIRALMDELGVTSRFQAGLQIGRQLGRQEAPESREG